MKMEISKYFIIISMITIAYAHIDKSIFIEMALDLQNKYALSSALIAMDINGYTNSLLVPLKLFSNWKKLSTIMNFEKFSEAIESYDKLMKPFLIIFIKSSEDFTYFVNITKSRKINAYWTFIIFTNEMDDSTMNICLHPKENYFNLMYDTKMFVLCYKNNLTIIISEWYALNSRETKVLKYATWNNTSRLVFMNEKSLFERRNSLEGVSLRITDLKKYSSDESSNESLGGLFQDVLELIALETNFTLNYQQLENVYGVYNSSTKQWNGILGKLIRNETDIGLAEIAQTTSRSSVVDFSVPIIPSYLSYFLKKPKNAWYLPWSTYYEPFSLGAANTFICILITAPLLVGYIKFKKRVLFNKLKESNNFYKTIQECYLDIWAIFCKMQVTDSSQALSLRIAYTSLYILSFILTSIYAAILMSRLTVFKPKLMFNSLQEFINDGSYKITVVQHSSYMDRLLSEENILSKKLKTLLLNDNELKFTTGAAIEQVCNGMKVVFLMDDWGVRVNTPSNCELVAFDQEYLVNMGFAFVKNSPYVGLFNYYLQRFTDYGILHLLKSRYVKKKYYHDSNYESVTLTSIIPIFFILTFGILFSLFILICEKIHFRLTIRPHEFANSRTNYWKPLIRPVK